MIKVKGLVVPYGVPNSFGETIRSTETFAGFLEDWRKSGLSIPMLWEHENLIGWWKGFVNKSNGLYLRGVIETPSGLKIWNKFGDRIGASITYVVAIRPGSKMQQTLDNRDRKKNPPITINRAGIEEVSLTTTPAFPNTWVRSLRLDT